MTDLTPRTAPAAVLWDMDGTLVDTEPYWLASERELLALYGREWTQEQGLQLVGRGLLDSAAILRAHGVDREPKEIVVWLTDRVRAHLKREGIPWRPGARELLSDLRRRGIPTALVTMSLRQMAAEVVAAIDFDAFDIIVAGDDVKNPKPDPEPYLRAADQLGVDIRDCVALEDSVVGIRAAVASGALTIGIPHLVDIPHSDGYLRWDTLAERSVAQLVDVWAQRMAESHRD